MKTLHASVAVLLASLIASGQTSQQAERPDLSPALHQHMQDWRDQHGTPWQLHPDYETGYARMIYGAKAEGGLRPVADADYVRLAREFIVEAEPLFGLRDETLVEDEVTFLPLGLIGSTDKMTVRFEQAVDGVPVRSGSVNALFDTEGFLLSLDSRAMPGLEGFDTRPSVPVAAATTVALRQFDADVQAPPTRIGAPALVIAKELVGKFLEPTLAWEIEVAFEQPGFTPEGYVYLVAARGAPRIVSRESSIHFFDVGGTVTANATPGTLPDSGTNPPTPLPMAYMRVTSSAGTTTTDANGNFNYPGETGPLSVTFHFDGTYNDVEDTAGSNYTLTTSLTGTGNNVLMNPSPTEFVTSQANVFYHTNLLRDWTRAINPADSSADFVMDANVNIDASCNAFYNGSSTNYYRNTSSCVNTAYSSVITHEEGHWMNDVYGSRNGGDGFGEGNADVLAMYLQDDPIVGEDFRHTGSDIRTGLNTRSYCGDFNRGCYGAVHADGEVLMGALWKVRDNLNSTHGDTTGDLIADTLFNAWMNAHDQAIIHSEIEIQWLVLDDDDGFIENGTPNYADIDDGFTAQGFPGFVLSDIGFRNLVSPADGLDENGPYGVAIDLTPFNAPSISSALLLYRVNQGTYTALPMTQFSGSTWKGMIPAVASPAKVSFYLAATDSLGNTDIFPADAPTSFFDYTVGTQSLFYSEDFESAGDNGWTHAQVANQDDWQHDAPQGESGTSSGVSWSDPSSAASGTRAWGNDLGVSGFNGAYQADTENYLLSPVIDLSGANGAILRFQRWLTIERGIYDQARVFVNGAQVWENDLLDHTVDTSWNEMEIDISAIADGDANTQLEFRLISDGGLNLGGWTLDDVEIFTVGASPTTCLPVTLGAGSGGSMGPVAIDSAGQPGQRANADFVVKVKNGLPGATAYFVMGAIRRGKSSYVGSLSVRPHKIFTRVLDCFGQATLAMPIPDDSGLVGETMSFQVAVDDPGVWGPFATSPALQVTICD